MHALQRGDVHALVGQTSLAKAVLRGDGALAKVDVHALPWIQPTGRSNLRRFYKAQNEEIEQLQADETLLLSGGLPTPGGRNTDGAEASTASLTGGASADEEQCAEFVLRAAAPLHASRALCDLATARGSMDNITALVVDLEPAALAGGMA